MLEGKSRVLNKNGEDVPNEFITAAEETLKIAKQLKVKEFIAKQGSLSCGCGQVYYDSFSGKLNS